MDTDDGIRIAEDVGNARLEIVQGIAMFGEHDQFATMSGRIAHLRLILKYVRELRPLAVTA